MAPRDAGSGRVLDELGRIVMLRLPYGVTIPGPGIACAVMSVAETCPVTAVVPHLCPE